MGTVLKAFGVTAVTAVPVAIKHYVDPPWDTPTLALYIAAVFAGGLKVFKPDERFRLVRNPTLDTAFEQTFSEDFELAADSDVKAPFRVHVFTPRWGKQTGVMMRFLPWIVPRRKLCVTYTYNSHPSYPDHGRSWINGHGLVWQAYHSGEAQFSMQQDEKWKSCGLTADEEKATSHVFAVFAIPLRRPAQSEAESVSSRVTAVLSFDALTQDAAETLKLQYDLFKSSKNDKLLDRARWVSLYF